MFSDNTRQDIELIKAYLGTTFMFEDRRIAIRGYIRVGQQEELLDRLLTVHSEPGLGAAYITAWNPISHKSNRLFNEANQRKLECDLSKRAKRIISGGGYSEDHEWPPEPSFLAIGIQLRDALALARKYRQNAFVWVERGKPSKLIITDFPYRPLATARDLYRFIRAYKPSLCPSDEEVSKRTSSIVAIPLYSEIAELPSYPKRSDQDQYTLVADLSDGPQWTWSKEGLWTQLSYDYPEMFPFNVKILAWLEPMWEAELQKEKWWNTYFSENDLDPTLDYQTIPFVALSEEMLLEQMETDGEEKPTSETDEQSEPKPRLETPEYLDWKRFNLEGIALAKQIKAVMGDKMVILYARAYEDPNRERQRWWLIADKFQYPDFEEQSVDLDILS